MLKIEMTLITRKKSWFKKSCLHLRGDQEVEKEFPVPSARKIRQFKFELDEFIVFRILAVNVVIVGGHVDEENTPDVQWRLCQTFFVIRKNCRHHPFKDASKICIGGITCLRAILW